MFPEEGMMAMVWQSLQSCERNAQSYQYRPEKCSFPSILIEFFFLQNNAFIALFKISLRN